MFFDRKDFSDQLLLDLYRTLLFPTDDRRKNAGTAAAGKNQ